jgi:hypothetical protein
MYAFARDLWTEALRSEEFDQCKGALTLVDEYGGKSHCCLGVLSEVAIKAGVKLVVKPSGHDDRWLSYDGESGVLPLDVMHWAGLTTANPMLGDGVASQQNDDNNQSFMQIADLIDEFIPVTVR